MKTLDACDDKRDIFELPFIQYMIKHLNELGIDIYNNHYVDNPGLKL